MSFSFWPQKKNSVWPVSRRFTWRLKCVLNAKEFEFGAVQDVAFDGWQRLQARTHRELQVGVNEHCVCLHDILDISLYEDLILFAVSSLAILLHPESFTGLASNCIQEMHLITRINMV